jgi:ketosteroid isomerase-like protein
MRRRFITVTLIGILTSACAQRPDPRDVAQQGAPTTDAAVVRQAIEAANAGLIAAMEKGDSLAAASFYDPEAWVMPQGMDASMGRPEVEKTFAGLLGNFKIQNMKLQIHDVVASGDLAVETGHYEWTFVPTKGKPMPDKGKYVVAWRRQADGSWKLFRDIFNNDAPEKAAAPNK